MSLPRAPFCAVVVALVAGACLPPVAPVEGKTCEPDGSCPAGLSCSMGRCLATPGDSDGGSQCGHGDPAVVFCTGFEEGSKLIWDDMDGNPDSENALVADPGPFGRPDNHVGWLKELPGAGTGTDLVKVLPASQDKVFTRWFIKYPAGFDFGAESEGSSIHGGSRDLLGNSSRPSGTDFFSVGVDYLEASPRALYLESFYAGMYQMCAADPCNPDTLPCIYDSAGPDCTRPSDLPTVTPPALVTEQWYCVETMIDLGSPTSSATGAAGATALWLDGVAQGSWTGLWFRSVPDLKATVLYLHLAHSGGQHSLVGVYYDDVVVSTQRVGCQ